MILGYISITLMGVILGLIGAGGSILTVPIMVYCFKIQPLQAITYSLLVVGITALFGSISYYKKSLVNLKAAIIFAIPSAIAVFLTRHFFIPNLPETIATLPKESFLMLSFTVLMFLAALSMLKKKSVNLENQIAEIHPAKLIFGSSLIGFVTGSIGAGGGFLIVPTLISLFKLETKKAIGTSLTIIAINSLIGFKNDLFTAQQIDYHFLMILSCITVFGMIAGIFFSTKFDGNQLKKTFAYFVISIALLIAISEIQALLI